MILYARWKSKSDAILCGARNILRLQERSIVISGSFRENPAAENALTFEIPTDQSAFPAVIAGIEGLKERYGGMQGVK